MFFPSLTRPVGPFRPGSCGGPPTQLASITRPRIDIIRIIGMTNPRISRKIGNG